MTRDDVIEKMARAIIDTNAQTCKLSDQMDTALTALEQSIPGLGGVIEGTHEITLKGGELAAIEKYFGDAMLSAAEEKGN